MQFAQNALTRTSSADLTKGSDMSVFGSPSSRPAADTPAGSAAKFGFAVFPIAPVHSVEAITDRGRKIPLFHYEAAVIAVRGQQLDLRSDADHRELLRWG